MNGPTALDDYEFDLRGFLVIRGALTTTEVDALNDAYDRFPDLGHGERYGNAQRRDYTSDTGFELHNVLDCGDSTFDVLIDHPSWVDHARRYAGEEGTYVEGITIDEHIATSRETGGHHPVHSGGHDASIRTQFAMHASTAEASAAPRVSVASLSFVTGHHGLNHVSVTARHQISSTG